MIKLESLYTQENAENGVWKEFTVPTTGEKFKLRLAGADSFKYRELIANQNATELARPKLADDEYNTEKEIKRRHQLRCEQIVSLVTDWEGFEENFTEERCLNLLINAPFVLIEIDNFAAQRINFMVKH